MVAMRLLQAKTAVRVAAVGLLLCSAACLIWAVVAPLRVAVPSASGAGRPASRLPEDDVTQSSAAELPWDELLARRFQQPLHDPPPDVPAPVVLEEPPPPPLELLATMPETGGGHAMIRDEQGKMFVLSLGATVTAGNVSAEIVAVRDDSIDLRQGERVMTVKLKVD